MTAATWLVWLAWIMAVFGAYRAVNYFGLDAVLRFLIVGALSFIFAFGAVLLNRWFYAPKLTSPIQSALPKPEPEKSPETGKTSLPHLKLSLILDSVTAQQVTWHLEVESDRPIEKILTRYVGPNETSDTEAQPAFDRNLSPGDKLSITGPPWLNPHGYNRLNVTLIYNVVGNIKDQYASTFEFFFIADKARTVAPEGVKPTENLATSPDVQGATDAVAAFRRPMGTMALKLGEVRPDGKPNVTNLVNPVRALTFDPVYGTAGFKMKFPSGESVTLTGPLQKRLNGFHELIVTWDESKGIATLMVDGVEAKQVKE